MPSFYRAFSFPCFSAKRGMHVFCRGLPLTDCCCRRSSPIYCRELFLLRLRIALGQHPRPVAGSVLLGSSRPRFRGACGLRITCLRIGNASTAIRLPGKRHCAKNRWGKKGGETLWGRFGELLRETVMFQASCSKGWKHFSLVPPTAQRLRGAFCLQPVCRPRCRVLSSYGSDGSVLPMLSCLLR